MHFFYIFSTEIKQANIDESLKVSLAKKAVDEKIEKEASHNYQNFWKGKNTELVLKKKKIFKIVFSKNKSSMKN